MEILLAVAVGSTAVYWLYRIYLIAKIIWYQSLLDEWKTNNHFPRDQLYFEKQTNVQHIKQRQYPVDFLERR
jgi:hypothetical protein